MSQRDGHSITQTLRKNAHMPRKKTRRVPLSPEDAQKATDEFMLERGRMSIWYEAWYQIRGKAIIEAKEKAHAKWEADQPVIVRWTPKEIAAPASLDSKVKAAGTNKPLRPRGIEAAGVIGLAAVRKRVAERLAKLRAARARSGNRVR